MESVIVKIVIVFSSASGYDLSVELSILASDKKNLRRSVMTEVTNQYLTYSVDSRAKRTCPGKDFVIIFNWEWFDELIPKILFEHNSIVLQDDVRESHVTHANDSSSVLISWSTMHSVTSTWSVNIEDAPRCSPEYYASYTRQILVSSDEYCREALSSKKKSDVIGVHMHIKKSMFQKSFNDDIKRQYRPFNVTAAKTSSSTVVLESGLGFYRSRKWYWSRPCYALTRPVESASTRSPSWRWWSK